MSSVSSPCSADLLPDARRLGFHAVGVADALPVDHDAVRAFDSWIASGRSASMNYLKNYPDLRRDPSLLLEGARSVIVCAMSYYHAEPDPRGIALYAHGDDYHELVRQRLKSLADIITERYGGSCRICVDTAPLMERYWARRAGVGFIGMNGCIIVPGAGSWVFLGEIITTVKFLPDNPATGSCGDCGRCLRACPTGALSASDGLDARRCLSYLTIEHRGDLPDGTDLHGCLYGCDACQRVCPHNQSVATTPVDAFNMRQAYRNLTPQIIADLTPEQFSTIFRHSPIKRAKLAGLRRNALLLLK